MKNRIKKLLFLFLFTTAIFANYCLIFGKEGIADTPLLSLKNITSAQAEEPDPGPYPFWDEACIVCTNSNGQNGVILACELAWAVCWIDLYPCSYGYC